MHHHANGCFDLLIAGDQSVKLSRESISILSEKYKRFWFAHPVITGIINIFTFGILKILPNTTATSFRKISYVWQNRQKVTILPNLRICEKLK